MRENTQMDENVEKFENLKNENVENFQNVENQRQGSLSIWPQASGVLKRSVK